MWCGVGWGGVGWGGVGWGGVNEHIKSLPPKSIFPHQLQGSKIRRSQDIGMTSYLKIHK